MANPEAPSAEEVPKLPRSAAGPSQAGRAGIKSQACSSDSDGSASIDEDELSESGSEEYCGQTRKGGSRRTTAKSPMRKRRKRPEWTLKEEETLAQVHCGVGNQWSVIAARLPGRTANEVKNIWHSTLRSKHLKARSLLRAYATALNGRWDDEAARQDAYNAALSQHVTSGNAAQPSARPADAGSLPADNDGQEEPAETPSLGTAAGLSCAGGLPDLAPPEAQTPDSSRSPPAALARQRAGRGPPATAPRPLASDRAAGRGGQQRHQPARRPPSPTSCPARGPPARGDVIETHGGSSILVRRSLGTKLGMSFHGQEPDGGAAPEADIIAATTPQNEFAPPPAAVTTAARPLPLSLGGHWGPQLQQRAWPQPHTLQVGNVLDLHQPLPQQPPPKEQEQQQQQQQEQEQEQQTEVQQRLQNEVELLHAIAAVKAEPSEHAEGAPAQALAHPSQGRVLGLDPMDTWLGRLDPSMMLHDDEAAAREHHRRGEADSANDSSVVRAISVSAAMTATAAKDCPGEGPEAHQLARASGEMVESGRSRSLTWPRPGHRELGLPNAAAHHGRAGPASGAWSTNDGAGGPHLQAPPSDGGGAVLRLPALQAAAPDSSTAMAISPAARSGGGAGGGGDGITQDPFSLPPGQWRFGNQDRVPALTYGPPGAAGGTHAASLDASAGAEGHGRPIAPPGWSVAVPRGPLPFNSKPAAAGLARDAWQGPVPSSQQLGMMAGAGGMVHPAGYMVPVQGAPMPQPMVFAAPPHAQQPYHGHPSQYEHFGRRQRMMYHQQQQYQQQEQQYLHQHHHHQQQQYQQQEQQQKLQVEQQQEQFRLQQQLQAYQQAAQRQQQEQQQQQQKQQQHYPQQQQQFKQEPQVEPLYQLSEAQQLQQQQLLQQLSAHQQQQLALQQQASLPLQQQRLQHQAQQLEQQQPTQQQQQLEQHADSLSSSDVITMGLDSLQDPQLRWCLMEME